MEANKRDLAADLAICDAAVFKSLEFMGIPGYEVSNDGRVFSLQNWRGYERRELTQNINKDGYPYVRLTVNGKRKNHRVHRIVALAFLDPPKDDQREVRHIDGNRLNSRSDNLAWGTAKDNAIDRELHGRTARGIRNGFAKLTEVEVSQIKSLLQSGLSQREVAKLSGVSQKTVWAIKHNKRWRE